MDGAGSNVYEELPIGNRADGSQDEYSWTSATDGPYSTHQPWSHTGWASNHHDGMATNAMHIHGSLQPPFSRYPDEELQGQPFGQANIPLVTLGGYGVQQGLSSYLSFYPQPSPSFRTPTAYTPQQSTTQPPMQTHPPNGSTQPAYFGGRSPDGTDGIETTGPPKQKRSRKGQPREKCRCACGCTKSYYPLTTKTVTRCSKCRGMKDGACQEPMSSLNNITNTAQPTASQNNHAQPMGGPMQPCVPVAPFFGAGPGFQMPPYTPAATVVEHKAPSPTSPMYPFGQTQNVPQMPGFLMCQTDGFQKIPLPANNLPAKHQDTISAVHHAASSVSTTTAHVSASTSPAIDQATASTSPALSTTRNSASTSAPDQSDKQYGEAGKSPLEAADRRLEDATTSTSYDTAADESYTRHEPLRSDVAQRTSLTKNTEERSTDSYDDVHETQKTTHQRAQAFCDDQFNRVMAKRLADAQETPEEVYEREHPFEGYTELFRDVSTIVEPKDVAKWNDFVENNISDQSMKVVQDAETGDTGQGSTEGCMPSPSTVLGKRGRASDSEDSSLHARKHQRASTDKEDALMVAPNGTSPGQDASAEMDS
ncbi:hypothetical protein LTR36_003889 [Oleoguttula mirabilis]|uniref:Zn(2)-C6 fungal-type domain-containing protein n=1 Tax=Oleoguttula mirabilis TaxID=1507867 RepID=A0AAV9JI10_9PEZI|nr:hypothetical protein LTR36_003889 [Oleoguttula mirabilis]